jgi:hypothetical protein
MSTSRKERTPEEIVYKTVTIMKGEFLPKITTRKIMEKLSAIGALERLTAKKNGRTSEDIVFETMIVMRDVFMPNVSFEKILRRLSYMGRIHELMWIAWPSSYNASGDRYGDYLDGFEGTIYSVLNDDMVPEDWP